MIEAWIPQGSSYAAQIDFLVWAITILVGLCFLVAEGLFIYWILKFRAGNGKAQYITGEEHHTKKWVHRAHAVVLLFDAAIIVLAVRVWYHIKQELPPAESTVRVIAQQWAWSFVHPGPDGAFDTPDDIATVDELHVQNDTLYHYKLEARDVLHSFSVPVWRLKQDAIPGRVITGWFKPTLAGEFDIQCTEICGLGHGVMAGRVFVETPEQHRAWMTANARTPTLASASASIGAESGD